MFQSSAPGANAAALHWLYNACMSYLTIPALSDLHVHLRQGSLLEQVAPYTDRSCAYALVMPNLTPPVTTVERLNEYRQALRQHLKSATPLMTFKLLASTTAEQVRALRDAGATAAKLYPEGVTTNSEDGIGRNVLERPEKYPGFLDALGELERSGLVLCLHGEMPGSFSLDREREFLPFVRWLIGAYPNLRIVLEHITGQESVQLVEETANRGRRLAATITAHHLMLTLDDVIGDRLQPHHFCKPIAKRPEDREALWRVIQARHPAFFLGSDTAPHPVADKECAHGCAGVFSAPVLPEILAELLEQRDALSALPGFISQWGNEFYGLRRPERGLRLVKQSWRVPALCGGVVPLSAGKELAWRMD
jgi:dihydroorotase